MSLVSIANASFTWPSTVETIGDAYMGVTNLTGEEFETHVKQVAEYAIDIIAAANKILIDEEAPEKGTVKIRVGRSH